MQLKYIKHPSWFLKIEIAMFRVNLGLERDIVPQTLEKWLKCGQKRNSVILKESKEFYLVQLSIMLNLMY